MSPIKELLLAAIATAPESVLEKTLNYLESELKSSNTAIPEVEPILRNSKAKDLLRFAGTWQGDDFEECLQYVYESRSQAEF